MSGYHDIDTERMLKERIKELEALVLECAEWNWLDEDAGKEIPKEVQDAVDALTRLREKEK